MLLRRWFREISPQVMDSRPPANGPEPHLNPHQSISTIQIMSTQSYPTLYTDNPNYTKPLYDFKPHQIKLFDNPWIQPIKTHFSTHGLQMAGE